MTAADADTILACVLAEDVANDLERLAANVAHAAEPNLAHVVGELHRLARVQELVTASLAALRDGTHQDVLGARAALRVASVELQKLAQGGA